MQLLPLTAVFVWQGCQFQSSQGQARGRSVADPYLEVVSYVATLREA